MDAGLTMNLLRSHFPGWRFRLLDSPDRVHGSYAGCIRLEVSHSPDGYTAQLAVFSDEFVEGRHWLRQEDGISTPALAVAWLLDTIAHRDRKSVYEAHAPQPHPEGTGPEIFPLVEADLVQALSGDVLSAVLRGLEARRTYGINQYGEPLMANNGRDAEVDAQEEAIDLALYLKQGIVEGQTAWGETYALALATLGSFYEVTSRKP